MKAPIEQTRTFNFPLALCYDNLLQALKTAQLNVKSQKAETHSLVAFWTQGMVQFTLAAACSSEGEDATLVTLTFRDDLTPFLKRAGIDAPIVHTTVERKMEQIFEKLSGELGLESEKPARIVEKLQRTSRKTQRIDYLSFFCLAVPLLWLFHSTVSSTSGFSIILDFSAGLLLWTIYNFTLRRLWIRLSPRRFMEWACSNCNTVVPEAATRCPTCDHEFSPITTEYSQPTG